VVWSTSRTAGGIAVEEAVRLITNMANKRVSDQFCNGLIVSCQAAPGSPLYGTEPMARMAQAAVAGGAVSVRVRGVADVEAVKKVVNVPVIGLTKRGATGVYITPYLSDAVDLERAGADVVAVDATLRPRPDSAPMEEFLRKLKHVVGVPILADVDSVEAGVRAANAGADLIATTLAGYTAGDSPEEPDFSILEALVARVSVPVIAEGRYRTEAHVRRALSLGAHAVVVGGAITDPIAITRRLVRVINGVR
jgi:N-acylglucosamine-6-phosphate 2-epimerase